MTNLPEMRVESGVTLQHRLERDGNLWLGAIALLHAVLAVSLQISNGAIVEPIPFIIAPAAVAGIVAIVVWMSGFRFHWWANVAFVGWWVSVMWTQVMIFAAASAAV